MMNLHLLDSINLRGTHCPVCGALCDVSLKLHKGSKIICESSAYIHYQKNGKEYIYKKKQV